MEKLNAKTLEELATLLIKGKISNERANFLAKSLKKNKLPRQMNSPYKVRSDPEGFSLVDKKGEVKAYVYFYVTQDLCGDDFLRITEIVSFEPLNGNSSPLFKSLYSFASKKKLSHILAEVDRENDMGANLINREGFYPVGEVNSSYWNVDRAVVRKDCPFI